MKLAFPADFKQMNIRRVMYTRRYLVIGLSVFLLSALMGIFALVPQITADVEMNTELREQKRALASLRQKIDALQETLALMDEQTTSEVDAVLPSEKPLLQLMAAANQAATQTQVSISEVETTPGKLATASARTTAGGATTANAGATAETATGPLADPNQPKTKVRGVATLYIEITVKGTLANINRYIQRVEESAPFIDISKISLNNLDQVEGQPLSARPFQAELGLTTFYFTQSLSVAVDAPLPEISSQDQEILDKLAKFTYPDVRKQQTIQGGGLQDLFGVINGASVEGPSVPLLPSPAPGESATPSASPSIIQ